MQIVHDFGANANILYQCWPRHTLTSTLVESLAHWKTRIILSNFLLD